MSANRAKGLLLAAVVWCLILTALAVAYKLLLAPYFAGRLEGETGSQSQYTSTIVVAADSFSGYCVLRSAAMRDQLKAKGIKIEVQDDSADYVGRMKALDAGRVQMAVFTIDSFLTSSVKIGRSPGTIVLVLDETKGADALVAYKEGVASIQDLDNPDARIVATPSSPSEFLSRVVLAHFSLPRLPKDWIVPADGAGDVYKMLRAAKREDKRAYALWEPYVSMALAQDGVEVLLDSSKTSGLIVDVLVAQREFLADHPDLARDVVETYLRVLYSHTQQPGGLGDLVMRDARETGAERLSKEQAQALVDGVHWKNTMENYAHFGLLPEAQAGSILHLEDIIANIAQVLVQTDALTGDPVEDKAHTMFYDRVLRDLQASDFHPGKKMSVLDGVGLGPEDLQKIRGDKELPKLSESQWEELVEVGEMRVQPISFARGTARINIQSERDLSELARRLTSLPQYYLVVVGHSRAEGDVEANVKLARERAEAATQVLRQRGISVNRIGTKSEKPSRENGSAQSVSFVVGQAPY
ncbi:MAG: OmpA family protein [bacterium]|nr:OmpA family protein [bacterium]